MSQKKKAKSAPRSVEAWLSDAQVAPVRCGTCKDKASHFIRETLQAVLDAEAFRVTKPKIYDRVEELSPGFKKRVGFHAFRLHMLSHEPLWKELQQRGVKS